jgi:hypothetical protein
MNRVEKLREARASYAVKFRDFLHISTKNPSALICFFEGEDIKYYGPRINTIHPGLSWFSINCGGKGAMVKIWTLISEHSHYAAIKTAFFCDHDFDPPTSRPSGSNVYVTPSYSVENLYVNSVVARKVFESEFGLTDNEAEGPILEKCLTLFTKRLEEFLDAVEPLNAWILFYRQAEATDPACTPLNLASLNFHQLVLIDLDAVKGDYDLFKLETSIPAPRAVTNEQLEETKKLFQKDTRHIQFRGKYQAHFMRVFLTKLACDANSKTPTVFPAKRSVPFNPSDRNFLSDLTQYAETPSCLRQFLATLN